MLYGYRPIRLWYSDTLWPGSREQKWDWLEDRPEGDLADRPAPVYWWFWMSGQLDRLNFSFASLMMDAPKPVASGASLAGPVHIECIEKEVRLEHHWRDASLQWCTQKSTVVSQSVSLWFYDVPLPVPSLPLAQVRAKFKNFGQVFEIHSRKTACLSLRFWFCVWWWFWYLWMAWRSSRLIDRLITNN